MKNMTPREKIAKARINLLTDYPFFGNLCMRLVPRELSKEEVQKYGITAMAVDIYGNVLYNPEWVSAQSDVVMKAALVHEVMHLALKHLVRVGTRDKLLFNIAADAVINEILSETFTIPSDWVRIPEMKGKSAEEIYDWLVKNMKTAKVLMGLGFDKHLWAEGNGQNETEKSPFWKEGQLPFDETRAVRDAYNFAKQQGKLPAGLERIFADILNPQLNWRDLLRKFIAETLPHDYSYTRPNKKSEATGFYIPMVKRENIELVIAVDSSGSISDSEYAEFLSEVYAMCRQFEAIRGTLLICDAEIQNIIEIDETFDPYSIKGRGWGGTDARPVYRWIEENKPNTKLLVYFTDGWITIPNTEYPFHTLWIISSNGRTDDVNRMENATVVKMNGE